MCSMKAFKSILIVAAVACFVMPALTGCSDKPENKAQAQLTQSTDRVLDEARDAFCLESPTQPNDSESIDKLDAAIAKLESEISKNRQAKEAVDSATLAKANLIFAKAQKMHAKLSELTVPVTRVTNSIVSNNNRIGELISQKDRLQALVEVDNERTAKLNELINGSIENEGLTKTLQARAAELDELNTEINKLDKQQQQTLDAATDLRAQADEKLRQAQNAAGQQKVELSTEGYELTSQSNHKQVQAQELANRIELVRSKVDIVKPVVEKLKADIRAAQEQISAISASTDFAQLKSQLQDVSDQLNTMNGEIGDSIKTLGQAKAEYLEKSDEIIAVLDAAIADYEKVRSSSARSIASEKNAVSCFWKASVFAEKVAAQSHYITILESVKAAMQDNSTVDVDALVESGKTDTAQFGKAAFENYDKSCEIYGSISGNAEYTCSIKKRQLLALYAKLMLAEQLGEYEISDKAAEQIDPLIESVKACDPDFSRSLVAKLVDGKMDFVPVLQIDNTEYYEGIRTQYQTHGWPKLPLDQREGAVKELLANLEKLEHEETFDREAYDSILGPEKQKLVAALERGFEEEAVNSSDPNGF